MPHLQFTCQTVIIFTIFLFSLLYNHLHEKYFHTAQRSRHKCIDILHLIEDDCSIFILHIYFSTIFPTKSHEGKEHIKLYLAKYYFLDSFHTSKTVFWTCYKIVSIFTRRFWKTGKNFSIFIEYAVPHEISNIFFFSYFQNFLPKFFNCIRGYAICDIRNKLLDP